MVATESLVRLGSVVDHPDKNPWPNNGGRTPLHWACYKGHADIAAKLCELGANKEAVDLMKRTPLHWAARRGNAECVQVVPSIYIRPFGRSSVGVAHSRHTSEHDDHLAWGAPLDSQSYQEPVSPLAWASDFD